MYRPLCQPTGGNIIYHILFDNPNTLALDRETQAEILTPFIEKEDALLASSPETSYFAYFVARPKPGLDVESSEVREWLALENAREDEAAENDGNYYPITTLQKMTQHIADLEYTLRYMEPSEGSAPPAPAEPAPLGPPAHALPARQLVKLAFGASIRAVVRRVKRLLSLVPGLSRG